jgi:dihydroflavonol-4-reductase
MPALITGGSGFLGVNLVRLLVSQGLRVRVMVRPSSPRRGLESPLVEFVPGDVTDARSVQAAVAGCDRVYHLAAWVQITPWGMSTARRINVEGTRNVCAAALAAGVTRMVHTSSIATVAAGSIDRGATENDEWNIRGPQTPYYRTKLESEAVVREHIARGLDAVIVNPTYLVGPWDIKPSAGRMAIQIARRRIPVFPTRGGINFVDVRDAAEGHLQAMDRGRTGERYLLGGENLSYRSYAELVCDLAGVPRPRIALPSWPLYPFAALCNLGGRVVPSWFRDANLCVLHSAFLEHYVSSAKAEEELGYRARPVRQAVRDALLWFVHHGYMPRFPNFERLEAEAAPAEAASR